MVGDWRLNLTFRDLDPNNFIDVCNLLLSVACFSVVTSRFTVGGGGETCATEFPGTDSMSSQRFTDLVLDFIEELQFKATWKSTSDSFLRHSRDSFTWRDKLAKCLLPSSQGHLLAKISYNASEACWTVWKFERVFSVGSFTPANDWNDFWEVKSRICRDNVTRSSLYLRSSSTISLRRFLEKLILIFWRKITDFLVRVAGSYSFKLASIHVIMDC
jgi:hypothetical protein